MWFLQIAQAATYQKRGSERYDFYPIDVAYTMIQTNQMALKKFMTFLSYFPVFV